MDGFSQRYVPTADGTMLSLHEAPGDGPLIVALHGFTGAASTMLALLDSIRDGRPALAIDLVGHGESDSPSHLDSYSMASVVDQVLSVIGPHDPFTVHLVGYSMGGRVALSMAARAPWYFASITTLSATAGIKDPVDREARYHADFALASQIEEIGVEAFIAQWLQNPIFGPYIAGLDPEAFSHTQQTRNRNSETGLANSLRGTGTGSMPPVWDHLASLRSPLLSVAGSLDEAYVRIATEMAETAPFGRLSIIEDAGHVVHEEKFDDISSLLRSFLQSCDQAPRYQGDS